MESNSSSMGAWPRFDPSQANAITSFTRGSSNPRVIKRAFVRNQITVCHKWAPAIRL
jgi:hypothetical protein